ncbi:MAG TPA: hypothetical protein VM712_01055, partial [Gaiellales bacterium]|nr:hypothetical protein [Gaiellales bacterium]
MATDTHTARRPVLAVLPRITGLLNRAVTIALLALLVFWLAVNLVQGPGQFGSVLLIGFTNGALYALVALGYTLVYGIIELINFAHGDVFMLGSFLALTLIGALAGWGWNWEDPAMLCAGIGLLLIVVPVFCAAVNVSIDRIVYKPLRSAPKLAPLVSAIGVSFLLMNVGL